MTAKPKPEANDAKQSKKPSQVQASPKTETPLPIKRPVGRPTDYKPEYCAQVIELGKQGQSFEQIAVAIGVGTTTLERWREAHEDFRGALIEANNHTTSFYEKMVQDNIMIDSDKPRLSEGLVKFLMIGKCHKYREIFNPSEKKSEAPNVVINMPNGVTVADKS